MVKLFLVFLRLGATSFGGPVAHLGYFRDEFVERRGWLTEPAYADLVALCQFLPGPASSQVVIGIGLARGGVPGAVVASLGFTLPSMLLMIGFGYGLLGLTGAGADAAWIQSLKVVAAAVVAQAVWQMSKSLCPDRLRASIALGAATLLVLWSGSVMQVIAIIAGGLIGWRFCRVELPAAHDPLPIAVGRRTAVVMLIAFAVLLALALLPRGTVPIPGFELFAAMYGSGALVFGGGHVVLPLLEAETVRTGWVSSEAFLAGYGAAQALPGPLFTFAAFLGTVQEPSPSGWLGALLATAAIFLPSFLLVFGILPFWLGLRRNRAARRALAGVNAAVVGLLLAALYDPVFTGAIQSATDMALALVAFALLHLWRIPAWLLVVAAGGGTALIGAVEP
ncbi:MAG: chromate efflux transporter [Thiohalocapsa sp.]